MPFGAERLPLTPGPMGGAVAGVPSAVAALEDRLRVVIPLVLADSLATCTAWIGAEIEAEVDSTLVIAAVADAAAAARLLRCRGFLGTSALTLSAGLSTTCRPLPLPLEGWGMIGGTAEDVGVCAIEGAAVTDSGSSNSFSFEARSFKASVSDMGSGMVSIINAGAANEHSRDKEGKKRDEEGVPARNLNSGC